MGPTPARQGENQLLQHPSQCVITHITNKKIVHNIQVFFLYLTIRYSNFRTELDGSSTKLRFLSTFDCVIGGRRAGNNISLLIPLFSPPIFSQKEQGPLSPYLNSTLRRGLGNPEFKKLGQGWGYGQKKKRGKLYHHILHHHGKVKAGCSLSRPIEVSPISSTKKFHYILVILQ